jgi:large subunit ribosomal protein L35
MSRKPKKKLKLKSKRGAVKRFKLTATGKVKRGQSMKRHILTKKSQGRKRSLRKGVLVSAAETPSVRAMITGKSF